MKVRAIRQGFYGLERRYPADSNRHSAGAVFEIKPEDFSAKWMEKVEDVGPVYAASVPVPAPVAEKPKRGRPSDERKV